MAGMSISWRHAARALGLAVAAVAALALLPSLLRTPEPPPLDPDVGLTGFADAAPPLVEGRGDEAPDRSDRELRQRNGERKAKGNRQREGGEDERRPRSGRNEEERPRDDEKPVPTPVPAAVPASSPAASSPPPPAAPPPPPPPVPAPAPVAAPPPPPEPAGPPPGVRQFGP